MVPVPGRLGQPVRSKSPSEASGPGIASADRDTAPITAAFAPLGRRLADLLLDFIYGDRTRRSGRGLHSRLASDTA